MTMGKKRRYRQKKLKKKSRPKSTETSWINHQKCTVQGSDESKLAYRNVACVVDREQTRHSHCGVWCE